MKILVTHISLFIIAWCTTTFAQQIYTTKNFDITGQGSKGVLVNVEAEENEGFYKLQYISKTTDNKLQTYNYTYDYDFNFIDVKSTIENIDTNNRILKHIAYTGEEYTTSLLTLAQEKEGLSISLNTCLQKFDWRKFNYKSTLLTEKKLKLPYKQKDYTYINHVLNPNDSSVYILINHKKKTTNYKIVQLNKQGKPIHSKEFTSDAPVIKVSIIPQYVVNNANSQLKRIQSITALLITKKYDFKIVSFDLALNLNTQIQTINMQSADSAVSQKRYESFILSNMQQCYLLSPNELYFYSTTPANNKTQEPTIHHTCKIEGVSNQFYIWSSYAVTPSKNNSLKSTQLLLNDSVAPYQILFEYDETQNCLQRPQAIPRIQHLTNNNEYILDPGAPELILEPFIPYIVNIKSKKIIFFGSDHPCKSLIYCSVKLD